MPQIIENRHMNDETEILELDEYDGKRQNTEINSKLSKVHAFSAKVKKPQTA